MSDIDGDGLDIIGEIIFDNLVAQTQRTVAECEDMTANILKQARNKLKGEQVYVRNNDFLRGFPTREKRDQHFAAELHSGRTASDIAKQYDLSIQTIRNAAVKYPPTITNDEREEYSHA